MAEQTQNLRPEFLNEQTVREEQLEPEDALKLLFEIEETAAILKISTRHLHTIKCKELDAENNKLIRYINNGKRVLFPRYEIERYIRDEMKRQWGEE